MLSTLELKIPINKVWVIGDILVFNYFKYKYQQKILLLKNIDFNLGLFIIKITLLLKQFVMSKESLTGAKQNTK